MKKEPPKHLHPKKHSPQKIAGRRKSYFNLLGLAIIIILGIIIYSNSFNCSFHFDDFGNIVDNQKIQKLSDVKAWWNFDPNRPVAMFTFALNYHFHQLDIWGYHFVNLIIHLVNACLVWWFTLLIFSSPALKDHKIVKHKKVLAILTGLLFVSHPLATQSVTYIIQRDASLVALFYLLSIALYAKARIMEKANKSKYILFAVSFLSAVLAMLTKENSFTLPFAILLFEFCFIRTKKLKINFKDYRVIILIAAFLGVLLIIPLKFSFSIFKTVPPMQGHTYTLTPFTYLLTEFSVIAKYIQLLFLPVNQMLDYDFPIANSFFELRTLLCFLLLIALIVLAILLFKKHRIISFGIFWFFLTLVIESSIIPIANVIFEHRTYLPSFGFFLLLSSTIYILLARKNKYLALAVISIIIVSNSILTFQRNKVWKDELTFWNDNVAKAPNKARPIASRAWAYKNLGQWENALKDYTKALEINPDYADALANRGVAYAHFGELEKAIADYTRAIQNAPDNINAFTNRGAAYDALHQWDKAMADYTKAIEIKPYHASAYSNRGITFVNLNQPDKALADFSKAISLDPEFKDAYANRGFLYGNLGQWQKAADDFTKVLEIDPNNKTAYSSREYAYKKLQGEKKQ